MNGLILDAQDAATLPQCLALLRQGKLVVLPSETVYGIALNLRSDEARARVRAIKQLSGKPGWVIHVASAADALNYVPDASPLARRLMAKAWPGPVTLQFALAAEQIARLTPLLGNAAPEAVVDGNISLRCPDIAITRAILSSISDPVALIGAAAAGDPPVLDPSNLSSAIGDQMDAIVDAGLTRYNKTSTLVRIAGDKLQVIRPGVIDARIIHRLADQLILFVCSGNTCRSPMAAGIAARLLGDKLKVHPEDLASKHIVVESAGLHTIRGIRATEEAREAVKDFDVDIQSHISQPVTHDLLRRADVIYTMTEAHREEIIETMPAAERKTQRLDPRADIEDPLGNDIDTYRQVANRLKELVQRRLAELPL